MCEEQCEFRMGRSCADKVFALRRIKCTNAYIIYLFILKHSIKWIEFTINIWAKELSTAFHIILKAFYKNTEIAFRTESIYRSRLLADVLDINMGYDKGAVSRLPYLKFILMVSGKDGRLRDWAVAAYVDKHFGVCRRSTFNSGQCHVMFGKYIKCTGYLPSTIWRTRM